jgi:hypothetical protein
MHPSPSIPRAIKSACALLAIGAMMVSVPPTQGRVAGGPGAQPKSCVDSLEEAGASAIEAVSYCAAAFGNTEAALAAFGLAEQILELAESVPERTAEASADELIQQFQKLNNDDQDSNADAARENLARFLETVRTIQDRFTAIRESIVDAYPTGEDDDTKSATMETLFAVMLAYTDMARSDMATGSDTVDRVNQRKESVREATSEYRDGREQWVVEVSIPRLSRAIAVLAAVDLPARPGSTTVPGRPTPTPQPSNLREPIAPR